MRIEETTISDQTLDQAIKTVETSADKAKATTQEVVQDQIQSEKTVSEEKKDEETDQQFRSRLGRRVSQIETKIDSFINEIRLTTLGQSVNRSSNTATGEPEYISTADDVRRVISNMETERTKQINNYEDNYLNHLARLGIEEGLSDAEFNRLDELAKTSFNQTYSNYRDPATDAERNFLKAMRVIDKEKSPSHKPINLKGDTPKASGISSDQNMAEAKPTVQLDPYAQDFVNYHKIPEDKISKILGEKK